MSSNESVLRVGFFLDGYTLKKVNEYYFKHHRFHARLDFRELKNWVRDYAMKLFGKGRSLVELESHYYHPYVRFTDVAEASCDGKLDRFEKQLELAGFEVHYNLPEEVAGIGPNMMLLEDAYLCAYYHKIDVLVLLTTQGQYSTLPVRLKKEGIPTLLLGWNFMYEKDNTTICWRTDSCLRELSGYYVAMEQVAEKYPPRRYASRNLFLVPFSSRSSHVSNVWHSYLKNIIASIDNPKGGNNKSPAVARLDC